MQTRVEQIEHQIKDDHVELCLIVYQVFGKSIADKPEFIEQLSQQLTHYNKFMDGYKFVAGDTLTYADFMLWEALDMGQKFIFVSLKYSFFWLLPKTISDFLTKAFSMG